MLLFIQLGFFDILDIVLVSFILYLIYKSLKGTPAMNIFLGIFVFFLVWLIVQALGMELVSSIMGQFIGMGVVALLIVFQQEVRRFLLMIGTRYKLQNMFSMDKLLNKNNNDDTQINELVSACAYLSSNMVGALIVLQQDDELQPYINTGLEINADIKSELLENLFFKNSPLHDGAVVINKDKICAARCILPVTDKKNIPGSLGLRHRAAIGLSDLSDAHIIVISEETGNISFMKGGNYKIGAELSELKKFLLKDFSNFVVK